MQEKIMLGDFIYELRKEKGFTQAQLAEMVGVSNKAVSKWETGEANPELSLIPAIAAVLDITTDELLNCKRNQNSGEENVSGSQNSECENGKKASMFSFSGTEYKDGHKYEFVSDKKTHSGKPYLHINFANSKPANGVISIGFNAKGILAIGLISRGLFSIGLLSIGIFALGVFSLSVLLSLSAFAFSLGFSAGAIAVGTVAAGAVAIGYVSVGAVSIGYYAHTGIEGIAIGFRKFIHLSSATLK